MFDLHYNSFAEGFQRHYAALALGRSSEKRAGTMVNKELAALGERLFHDSYRSPSLWTGLKSTFLPGYGQLRGVHALLARPHAPHDLERAFEAIGATAQPRINTIRNVTVGGAGAGIGAGIGHLYGIARGQQNGQDNLAQVMQKMPLMERLKFTMSPQSYMAPARMHRALETES